MSSNAVALVKQLSYRRGQTLCFSDLPEVLSTMPDPDQRRRLLVGDVGRVATGDHVMEEIVAPRRQGLGRAVEEGAVRVALQLLDATADAIRPQSEEKYNPPRGYIATANHNINPPGYTPPLMFKTADTQFERITRSLPFLRQADVQRHAGHAGQRLAVGVQHAAGFAEVVARIQHQDHLLAALPTAEFERLLPHLERVSLRLGEVLSESGDPLQHALPAHQSGPDAITLEKAVPVHSLPGFDAGDVSVQDAGALFSDVDNASLTFSATGLPAGLAFAQSASGSSKATCTTPPGSYERLGCPNCGAPFRSSDNRRCEYCNEVVEASFRIHGGYGYSKEYEIERLYREAAFMLIGEGTSDIQKMIIGRSLLKDYRL